MKKIKRVIPALIFFLILMAFVFYKRVEFKNYLNFNNWLNILIMLISSFIMMTIIPLLFRIRNKKPYGLKEAKRISGISIIITTLIIMILRLKVNIVIESYPIVIMACLFFFYYYFNQFILRMKLKNDIKSNRVANKTTLEKKFDTLIAPNPKKKKTRSKVLITFMYGLILVFGAGVTFIIYIIISAPDFDPTNLYNKEATILYDVDGNEFAKIGLEKRELVTYDDLPEVLIDAIIATEDSRFFQHNGFDIARFTKAFLGQITGNSSAGGGSTLTMQIAKNAYTNPDAVSGFEGIVRKATDIYLSIFKLEQKYTKEEIIEFYVNEPWLGNNSYGVEQACQIYFGKSVKDLSLTEAALVAGMFQAPASYNPFNEPELAAKRRQQVLNLMVRHGYITKQQAEEAGSIPIQSLTIDPQPAGEYTDFIDTVIEEIEDRTGYDGYVVPMKIYTTMQTDKQDAVNKLMRGESYKFINDVVQMGIAVTDVRDGSIAAIGAGRNRVGERSLNLATQIDRQPGSTAKPFFAYGPLIEYNDASTYTPFFDEKYGYKNGTIIKNADGKYLGLMTLRYALARSRNIPALQAFHQLDPNNVSEFAKGFGIDYGENVYESSSLGAFNGMSPLSMSAAYGTFARGGYYIEPYSYTKIILRDSDEVIEYKPVKTRAASNEVSYMINSVLESAVTLGALGGPITISGTDVATKTGTSSIDRNATKKYKIPSSAIMDSWFDIYSPDYSISMWYGYKNLSSDYYLTVRQGNAARDKVAKILAKAIFEKNSKWRFSAKVSSVAIEKETFPAQLASPYTPSDMVVNELFKSGTEPVEVSQRYSQLPNPTNLKTSYNNGTITISWSGIPTPDAINTTYLQDYFNANYSTWAEKYYQQRITYNTNYIGSIGYQVYIKNITTGILTPLGYTYNTSYNYITDSSDTEYTFVIKSAYSIFKSNMSSGATITANPKELSQVVSFQMVEDTTTVNRTSTLSYYTDLTTPFTMYVNGIRTNDYSFTRSYYKLEDNNEIAIDKIPLNVVGTYKINYIVSFNNKKYNPSRKIIIN